MMFYLATTVLIITAIVSLVGLFIIVTYDDDHESK